MRCKLCGKDYPENKLSDEHYPAHSVGNDDIVQLDLVAMMDMFMSENLASELKTRVNNGESLNDIADNIFDNRISKPIYPRGRVAKTLCRECNTFLGKYDAAYLKFFNIDGNCKAFKGYQIKTKVEVIKSIYGKFLSVPEAGDETFDFIEFLRNENSMEYKGIWHLYFVKRDYSSDILGLKDMRTGKLEYPEGVVYEMSDDKFIFNLMNFKRHDCFKMTNIFEILNPDYQIVEGVGEDGGYHAQILLSSLFSEMMGNEESQDKDE